MARSARIVAIEGLDFEEASRAALERVGSSNERVGRFSQGFLESWAHRVARDYFEAADADDLAELWGEHTGRPPSTDEDYEALIRELREIVDRSPDDPELQELLGFVPGGSAKEVRERLSRRRGSWPPWASTNCGPTPRFVEAVLERLQVDERLLVPKRHFGTSAC